MAREVLSFLTDIRKTPTGEVRDSLRAARHIIDMEFGLDDAQNALAESMFRAGAAGDWLMPVWPELTQFPVPASVGTSVFRVNDPSEYVVGEFAFLVLGDQQFQQVEVAALGVDSVTITAPSLIAASSIAPLRLAYITGDLGGARWFKGLAVRKLEVEFRTGNDIAATPYDQYLGADLVTDPSVIASPLEAKLTLARVFIDNGFGPVVVEPMRDIIEAMTQIVHKDFGHAAMVRRKRWFRHLRGRDRSFWLPSWTHDLSLSAAVTSGQAYVDIKPLYGSPADLVGRHIIIDDGQGFLPRTIEAGVSSGGAWRLTIAALGRAVEPTARVMFLNRMRLDTDQIEMALTGIHYMETNVTAVEVNE